jgi:hypothetical protein
VLIICGSPALLAVDLYNRSGNERQLEAFIVHMSLAWLRLMQAKVEKDGGNLFIRDRRGRRVRHEDGGWKYKPLNSLTDEQFAENDPRRVNLTFFTGLRNIIEHRYERDIANLVAGRTQAYVLNYDRSLTEWFGPEEGVGQQLRFPIFISSITQDAVAALKEVRKRIPRGVLEWVQDFDTALEPELAADQQFDFRVYLVPHTGPKTKADAAMTFVKMDVLDDQQRGAVEHVQTGGSGCGTSLRPSRRLPLSHEHRDEAERVAAGSDIAPSRGARRGTGPLCSDEPATVRFRCPRRRHARQRH